MSRMTSINLPVKDLARSRAFFTGPGFGLAEEWSDEDTACFVLNDSSYALLHQEARFGQFTQQPLVDTAWAREVLVGPSATSREDVDTLAEHAGAGGGTPLGDAVDRDGMSTRAFLDPDGHQWSVTYTDLPGRG